MTAIRWGLFVGSLGVGLGLLLACSDEVEGPKGTGGAGGAGGAGGTGQGNACQPTDPICYGNRPPTSKGSECLAARDNSATPTTSVQMRQTWFRSTAPPGNTILLVYQILTTRSQIKLPACNMNSGRSGYIQLTDWDRSNPDITQQTLRTGYSTFVADETAARAAQVDGLCMAKLTYDDPVFKYTTPLKAGQGMNLPWNPEPTVSKRVATKGEVDTAKTAKSLQPGQGIFALDEATHTINGYAPLGWVVIWSSADVKIVLPIHEVETQSRFNDETLNCAGAYRPDRLSPSGAMSCDSTDPANPAWGCKSDTETGPLGQPCKPGDGPNYTKGYFLITELEQIYSRDLQGTLCVTYPTTEKSVADGWATTEPTTQGKWCRGSAKWNPDDPVAGLPMGDWCSTTNSAATPQCHDAYQSLSFGVGQAYPVKTGTCEK